MHITLTKSAPSGGNDYGLPTANLVVRISLLCFHAAGSIFPPSRTCSAPRTPARQLGLAELLERLEKPLGFLRLFLGAKLQRQTVDGRHEAGVQRHDLLQDLRGLVVSVRGRERLGILVRRVGVGLLGRLESLEGLLVFAQVLVLQPQAEFGLEIGREHVREGPAGGSQAMFRVALALNIIQGQSQVELRGEPVGLHLEQGANGRGRLGVLVLLDQRRPTIGLGQCLGRRLVEPRRGNRHGGGRLRSRLGRHSWLRRRAQPAATTPNTASHAICVPPRTPKVRALILPYIFTIYLHSSRQELAAEGYACTDAAKYGYYKR